MECLFEVPFDEERSKVEVCRDFVEPNEMRSAVCGNGAAAKKL